MTLQSNFSNNVKLAYKNSNKTLSEFSDEIGISRTTLQDILKGNSNSRIDTVEAVAKGLNTDPIALFSTNYDAENLTFLEPLLQLSDMASTLDDDEKEELASHCYAIIRILFGSGKEEK